MQWRTELEELLKTRPHLSKLQYLLDLGKRKKFDLPQLVKDQLDSMSKLSQVVKKTMAERADIHKLRDIQRQSLSLSTFILHH